MAASEIQQRQNGKVEEEANETSRCTTETENKLVNIIILFPIDKIHVVMEIEIIDLSIEEI